jgi:glutamine---fructose-6-phosphate transaminase (isomerizing)
MNNSSEKKYVIIDEIKSQGEKLHWIIKKYHEMENSIISEITDDSTIYFLGSGSSYNNSLMAEFSYNKLMKKDSYAVNSSEYIFNPDVFIKPYNKNKTIFILSRTGETGDTLLAQKILRDKKMFSIALTTFPESTIAKNSDMVVDFKELREESITSNRVVSSTAMFLLCLLYKLNGMGSYIDKIDDYTEIFFKNFDKYRNYISSVINEKNFKKFIFLGHGIFYSVSREAALKVREMSITSTESWPTLEFRQGYSTNIGKGDLIVLFLSRDYHDYQVKACREYRKTGADIMAIGEGKLNDCEKFYDYFLETNLELEEELLYQVYYQIFGQLLGCYQALKKNIDPSNPKDLDYIVKI